MGLLTAFKKPKKTLDLPPPPMPFEQVPLPPRPEGIPAPFPDSDQLEFPEIPAVEEELPAWEESPLPTISEEKETLPPRYEQPFSAPELPKTRASLKQLFVSIDDYQAIMQCIMEAKRTIAESEQLGEELTKLKDKEDKVFEDWRGQIEDIEKKLSYVDHVISKGELA